MTKKEALMKMQQAARELLEERDLLNDPELREANVEVWRRLASVYLAVTISRNRVDKYWVGSVLDAVGTQVWKCRRHPKRRKPYDPSP